MNDNSDDENLIYNIVKNMDNKYYKHVVILIKIELFLFWIIYKRTKDSPVGLSSGKINRSRDYYLIIWGQFIRQLYN